MTFFMRETATAEIRLREDGILSMRIPRGIAQTLADAEDTMAIALAATAGTRRPLLVDIVGTKPLDAEIRHYYAGQRLDPFLAVALLAHASPLGRMMGTVYLLVARPAIPSRLFTNEPEAVNWLKGFLS